MFSRKIALLLIVLAAVSCGNDDKDEVDNNSEEDTPALAKHGGARRATDAYNDDLVQLINTAKAKNVILLLGDGMGDAEITMGRNYAVGAAGALDGIDALPFTAQYTHYSVTKGGKPNYVTDSAASATAWSTGYKTYNGALAVDYKGQAVPTILELAQKSGRATGNVTTAEVQDATPAALFAHVISRGCKGPQETAKKCPTNDLAAGGLGSISEQLLNAQVDVTLGGGSKYFIQTAKAGKWRGKTLLEQAEQRKYQLVSTAAELESITVANKGQPLLGLFAGGNLPTELVGDSAVVGGNKGKPATCTKNPANNDSIPSLEDMTRKAIELLQKNRQGFFLQVEGASIDKQAHGANPCGQAGELAAFNRAVKVALDFAKQDGNTLVVVTADHAHSTQIVPNSSTDMPGLTQKVVTADGQTMTVSYATSVAGKSQKHTGTQLRVAAYGPQAYKFTGLLDQTDVFFIFKNALGL